MLKVVHPLRSDPYAVHLQFAAEQFKIHSPWAMVAGSIVAGILGITWLMMDLVAFLGGMSEIWLGDITHSQKLGAALFWAVWIALHCVGGIMFLRMAMEACRNPYKLTLDGDGHVIAHSLTGQRRIRLDSIKSIGVNLEKNCDETVEPGIRIQHLGGEVKLALFKGHERFVNRLKSACPAIGVYINGIGSLISPEASAGCRQRTQVMHE